MPVQGSGQVAATRGERQRFKPLQCVVDKRLDRKMGVHGSNGSGQHSRYIGAKVVFEGFGHGTGRKG